jgi:lipopolysaccharide transport system permease protein
MGATLFHAVMSIAVWALFYLAVHGTLHWTIIFLPFVLVPLVLFALGCAWFLASLGVFLRDVGQTTQILTSVLLFLSPVFFPASALPPAYQRLLALSPLTIPIEQAREIMVWGHPPDWQSLASYCAVGVAVALLGLAWFKKTRGGFADVL